MGCGAISIAPFPLTLALATVATYSIYTCYKAASTSSASFSGLSVGA
jgi:hypothetical protein